MHQIGIMQGRLTPSHNQGIQFFPFDNWENEFVLAKKIGIFDIEFIFDLPDYEKNPFWTSPGIESVKKIIKETGVSVNHLCADYFMRKPLGIIEKEEQEEYVKVLNHLLKQIKKIGGKTVEIPLLEDASIKNKEAEQKAKNLLEKCLPLAESLGIQISLETDLEPKKLLTFVQNLNSNSLVIVYDTGNSASLGYDPEEEIGTYGQYISSVQIKDRLQGGTTVALGLGGAQFEKVFHSLRKIQYKGNFILQVARGKDGEESKTISSQMSFVNNLITTHLK